MAKAKLSEEFQIRREDLTDIASLKANYATMTRDVGEIKESQKSMMQKMDNFIEKANKTFATKEEHKDNVHKINKIEEWLNGINLKIALVTGWFSVLIFIIERLWK